MAKLVNPTKVITGVNTRLSYANVWEPKSINGGEARKCLKTYAMAVAGMR